MQRDYDLFEQCPDGSPMWRGRVAGVLEVRHQLVELSQQTKNECFAIHLATKEVVARVNVGGTHPKSRMTTHGLGNELMYFELGASKS